MTQLSAEELAGIEARDQRIALLEAALKNAHDIFAAEIEALHRHIRALSASPVVTDAAVEAACVAYYDKTHHSDWRLLPPTAFGDGNRAAKDKFRSDMRAALEAALPALGKGGWQPDPRTKELCLNALNGVTPPFSINLSEGAEWFRSKAIKKIEAVFAATALPTPPEQEKR